MTASSSTELLLLPPATLPDEPALGEMLKQQLVYAPNAEYFSMQPMIRPVMRAKLVDWLFNLGRDLRLRRYSVYCAVNFVDRFLSVAAVERTSLQLVGLAALWMSSKLEERNPPAVTEMCDNTGVGEKQMVEMEAMMLAALEWNLMPMTPYSFATLYVQRLARLLSTVEPASLLLSSVMEIVDLATLEHESMAFQPSVLAAAAVTMVCANRYHHHHQAQLALVATGHQQQHGGGGELKRCTEWLSGVVAGCSFVNSPPPPDFSTTSSSDYGESEIQGHNDAALDAYLAKTSSSSSSYLLGSVSAAHWSSWRNLTTRWGSGNAGDEMDDANSMISIESTSAITSLTTTTTAAVPSATTTAAEDLKIDLW